MRDSTHTLVSLPLANMAWPFQRTGAACVYLILSGRPLLTPRFSRPAFASIEGDGERIFVAVIDVKRAVIAVVPAAYRPDATRVPELWLIPPGGKPLALGVLPSDRPTQIAIPATFADRARNDAGLAVSLEPPGGSPTGQPTGPVIGSGKLTNL